MVIPLLLDVLTDFRCQIAERMLHVNGIGFQLVDIPYKEEPFAVHRVFECVDDALHLVVQVVLFEHTRQDGDVGSHPLHLLLLREDLVLLLLQEQVLYGGLDVVQFGRDRFLPLAHRQAQVVHDPSHAFGVLMEGLGVDVLHEGEVLFLLLREVRVI